METKMLNLLVTGGAGFIGSHFIKHILETTSNYRVINYDLITYAGNLENLGNIPQIYTDRYVFVKGDIRNRDDVKKVFEKYNIDKVVHLAAESSVDRSIKEPEIFLTTNILGTQILLDEAKKYWQLDIPNAKTPQYKVGVKFVHVSTDEVYGSLEPQDPTFNENSPLAPNNPYSASKASSDLMVRAYHNTYNLPVNITRCTNNYGPNQFPEKLLPLTIISCANDTPAVVHGDGMQVRDWIHVQDHCNALSLVLEQGECGETYNIGANDERRNIDIVKYVLKAMGKCEDEVENENEDLITYVNDRLGNDRRYGVDNSKIKLELGWEPRVAFEDGIAELLQCYSRMVIL